MKAVLMSIQPKWCELIASGKKTVEVRKTKPKIKTPFKVYIYMTAGDASYPVKIDGFPMICHNNGGRCVIGEFVCDEIYNYTASPSVSEHIKSQCTISDEDMIKQSYMTLDELYYYESHPDSHNWGLLAWHISNLIIYDKPKELSEFYRECEKNECEDCPYLHFENTPNSYEGWCTVDEKIPLKRPPQSWCYVEEVR